MFGSFLPSALGWLVATKVYSATGADIVMESISSMNGGLIAFFFVSPNPNSSPTLCNLNAFASSDVVGFGVSWVGSAIFERA
jgi:hypothetical protein